MHKLLIEDDEGKTVAVPLIREEITIGRMDGNTIRLTEQNVSRKHARLTLRGGVLRIEDLGSYNGTSLNGSALSGVATLKDGDVILIGDYRLGIQEEKVEKVEKVEKAEKVEKSDKPSQAMQAQAESAAPAPAPAVEEAIEGQPTIPISTLAVQTAFSAPPARLVITSRFQAGAEFILDRPSQVIGRTPENDIVLNHKSISRHHAKVLRDGSRYTILDLESANGVRVGGVEHDKVELQSGDVIELGEVRLRFLSGDADLEDQPRPWYQDKKKLGLAGGLVVAAAAGALIFIFAGGPSVAPKPTPVAATPPSPVIPPAQPPVAPVAEPAKPAEPAVPVQELLAQAKANAHQEKWQEALGLIDKAAAQSPDSAEVVDLRKAITTEQKNGNKMAALTAAFANHEYDTVLQGTADIPDDSMYKAPANELHKNAVAPAIALHLENAKTKLAANECVEAKHEAELVLGLDGKNKRAAFVVKRCDALAAVPAPPATPIAVAAPEPKLAVRKPAAVVAARAPAPPPAAKPRPAAEAPRVDPAAGTAGDPDKLIKDAQQAWFRGQYASAIDSARKALRIKPNLANAYQIIAVCSCALHDAESAARAFEKLDDRNKLYVKSACQKSGIAF